MTIAYPQARDEVKRPFISDWDRDAAIAALQGRVGCIKDGDPASIEDRLFTVEMLLLDTIQRMERPPGLVDKAVKL